MMQLFIVRIWEGDSPPSVSLERSYRTVLLLRQGGVAGLRIVVWRRVAGMLVTDVLFTAVENTVFLGILVGFGHPRPM